jgi:hypothetical protein
MTLQQGAEYRTYSTTWKSLCRLLRDPAKNCGGQGNRRRHKVPLGRASLSLTGAISSGHGFSPARLGQDCRACTAFTRTDSNGNASDAMLPGLGISVQMHHGDHVNCAISNLVDTACRMISRCSEPACRRYVPKSKLVQLQETMSKLLPQIRYWIRNGLCGERQDHQPAHPTALQHRARQAGAFSHRSTYSSIHLLSACFRTAFIRSV